MSCLLLKYKMLKLAHVMYVNLGSPVFHSSLYCNLSFFLALAVVCWIMCVRLTVSQGKNQFT